MEDLYSRRTNLIIGFHGCDEDVANKVVMGEDNLKASENDYDWLGHGVYYSSQVGYGIWESLRNNVDEG